MIRWLYDHIFRGIGVLFLIGMITVLILALTHSRGRNSSNVSAPTPAAAVR